MADLLYGWLGILASAELGEPVRVTPLHNAKYTGLIGCDAQGLHVELAPALRGEELLRALYHELGHAHAGHVRRGTITKERPDPRSVYGLLLAVGEQGQELEAEQWAVERLGRLSARARLITTLLGEG